MRELSRSKSRGRPGLFERSTGEKEPLPDTRLVSPDAKDKLRSEMPRQLRSSEKKSPELNQAFTPLRNHRASPQIMKIVRDTIDSAERDKIVSPNFPLRVKDRDGVSPPRNTPIPSVHVSQMAAPNT